MSNDLEDRLAVQDVMLQYASTVDEKDYEGYRALFAKDVVVVGMGENDIHGIDEYYPWWKEAIDKYGFGMSSVRFICGTQDIHKELESRLTNFLGTEDTILYPSAFDANGGLFETIFYSDKSARTICGFSMTWSTSPWASFCLPGF